MKCVTLLETENRVRNVTTSPGVLNHHVTFLEYYLTTGNLCPYTAS